MPPIATGPDESLHAGQSRESPPDEDDGRIGYGRYASYTPAALGIVLVIVVAVIGYFAWRPDNDLPRAGALVDQPAPPFSLTLWDGDELTSETLVGRPVALNFWASWCAPCQEEMPAFEQVAAELVGTGLNPAIVGVGIKRDNEANARDLVASLGLTYPIGRDIEGDDPVRGPIERAFGIATYPATVFIRPDGTIYAIRFGQLTADEIRRSLQASTG